MDKGVNAKGISSDEKSGFVAYVDEIRKAEEKLRSFGVNMADAEKKQLSGVWRRLADDGPVAAPELHGFADDAGPDACSELRGNQNFAALPSTLACSMAYVSSLPLRTRVSW